jgi:hypothetical protein
MKKKEQYKNNIKTETNFLFLSKKKNNHTTNLIKYELWMGICSARVVEHNSQS